MIAQVLSHSLQGAHVDKVKTLPEPFPQWLDKGERKMFLGLGARLCAPVEHPRNQ